jgi:RNA polymerase sigma factor (sigma-70 family)
MRARVERQTDETFRQQLETLYREKKGKIYRAAYGITRNRQDAQDALQNVFVRLMQRPPSRDFSKDPEGYLCRAGINEALSMGRRRESQKLADANVHDLDIPVAAAVWGAGNGDAEHLEDLDRRLSLARDQLDPYLAAIITLHYDLKCQVAFIAKIFRRASPTIGMHLMRARRELKRLMFLPGGNNEMA